MRYEAKSNNGYKQSYGRRLRVVYRNTQAVKKQPEIAEKINAGFPEYGEDETVEEGQEAQAGHRLDTSQLDLRVDISHITK